MAEQDRKPTDAPGGPPARGSEAPKALPDRELKVIGTPFRRVDGWAKVTGTTRFADDLSFPRQCFIKLVRSTVPHTTSGPSRSSLSRWPRGRSWNGRNAPATGTARLARRSSDGSVTPKYDPSKPDGRGQEAPLKEKYRLIHEESLADQATAASEGTV